MANIFYSLCGEGRGHASRVRTMIENMRGEHEFDVFTSCDAYDFLAPAYKDTSGVRVHRIEGLRFHYVDGRLHVLRSLRHGLNMRIKLEKHIQALERHFQQQEPEIVVCDFEPLVSRAAHRHDVPVVSLDHQHFLLAYDLSSLPRGLRAYAHAMGWFVRAHGIRPTKTIVSGFFRSPLRKGYEDVTQVGPLLRPEVKDRKPTTGDYVLSYLRKATPPHVLEVLMASGQRIRIYGLGERPAEGNLTFHAIDQHTFVEDLAACRAVIAAAGNQLLGEALYFGKPFLALPEGRHYEQRINAHFLEQLGGGRGIIIEDLQLADVQQFLASTDTYCENLSGREREFDGTDTAVRSIELALAEHRARSAESARSAPTGFWRRLTHRSVGPSKSTV
ncbi:MAG: teichoic acid biosynthesis protein [Pirellulales bacterium]|nr:teichoic acid biosynthesis protein [Pirellulales bacterium]